MARHGQPRLAMAGHGWLWPRDKDKDREDKAAKRGEQGDAMAMVTGVSGGLGESSVFCGVGVGLRVAFGGLRRLACPRRALHPHSGRGGVDAAPGGTPENIGDIRREHVGPRATLEASLVNFEILGALPLGFGGHSRTHGMGPGRSPFGYSPPTLAPSAKDILKTF